MRWWLAAVLATACLSPVATSHAEDSATPAPLGLRWGMTTDQLKSEGVNLASIPDREFGTSFVATNLPAALADQQSSVLSFDQAGSLWRIYIAGKPNQGDPSGFAARKRYDELKAVLSEKYGKPQSFERVGGSIWAQEKNFISGIQAGENQWFSNFETATLFAQLGIKSNFGDGSYFLIFENKALKAGFTKAKKAAEKNAL